MARKVLLADDSVTAQNMGRKILADAGYEVITVNNGSAALKKIAEVHPDLIVLDVYMPGYSGLEVCQRLKESADTADVPVLLTVGKLEPFKPEESQRVRADAFIVKPFEASELLGTLSRLQDRVVPRSDGAKNGRVSRAVKNDAKDEGEGTWRDRIKLPSFKKDSPEPSPDDPALYNQINRDLRTVVDKSSIPGDATAEELAALAAVASKLGASEPGAAPAQETAAKEETQATVAETVTPASETKEVIETASAQVEEPAAVAVKSEPSVEANKEATAAPVAENSGKDVEDAIASLTGHENETKADDVPVTMAVATPENAEPRWKAVAVDPSAEESALSLEREMEKAYAAVAAQGLSSVTTAVAHEPVVAESVSEAALSSVAPAVAVDPVVETPAPVDEAATIQQTENAAPEIASAAEPQPIEAQPTPEPAAQVEPAAAVDQVETPFVEAQASTAVEPEPPAAQQQEAALAVAAGAERLIEDAKAAAPSADPHEIASIVENVMAQLRPKLVEEITRKLAAEKK